MVQRVAKYSTSNLPPRAEVRLRAGRDLPEWLSVAEGSTLEGGRNGLFERIMDQVNAATIGHEEFLARAKRGWLKWVPRYVSFGYGCLTEPMLLDYNSQRMLGLAVGFASEGVGLASYLLGVLCDEEELHEDRKLWGVFIDATLTVVGKTLDALTTIQEWGRENGHPAFASEIGDTESVRLLEGYQNAVQTLRSIGGLSEEIRGDRLFEPVKLKALMSSRGDVERCSLQAEQASQYLESQGVMTGKFAGYVSQTHEAVAALDKDTLEFLELCKAKINRSRGTMDLPPLTRLSDVVHEVARVMVASDYPYYPSPWREGRLSGGGRRSNLDLDMEKIASSTGFDIKTLRDYVERGRILGRVGAKNLAQVVQTSLRLRCHYRYYVCPVGLEGLEGGKGYKLVVKSPDEAPPRDALASEEVLGLMEFEPTRNVPQGRRGRPTGSTGKPKVPANLTNGLDVEVVPGGKAPGNARKAAKTPKGAPAKSKRHAAKKPKAKAGAKKGRQNL